MSALTPEQLATLRRCSRDEQAFLELVQLFENIPTHPPDAAHIHAEILDMQEDYICRLDTDLRLLYINKTYADLYDSSPSELRGKSLLSIIKPEAVPLVRQQLEEVMAQRRPLITDRPLRLPDNSILWVEWTNSPLFDSAGNVIGIQGVGRNMTARKLAEDALKESETLLRQIVEHSQEVFYLYDPRQRRILYINPAYEAIWGRPMSELYADMQVFLSAIHPDDMAAVAHMIDYDLSDSMPHHHEYRVVRPDGSIRHVRSRNYPITDPQGVTMQIVGIAEDVTEKIIAEQHLQDLQREREQIRLLSHFIHDVSHEFRTPLTIIYTSLHLLTRHTDEEKRLLYKERIINQINMLTRLVDDLNTMVRLDTGLLMDHALIYTSVLLRQLIEVYQVRFPERAFYLNLPDESLPNLIGSEGDLLVALNHLVDNAIRFSATKAPIMLTACHQPPYLVIKIEDSGTGIPSQHIPHVFKRFYRSDTAHTTRGFGLGLAIVKRIIELHQGSIYIESELDKGTVVTLQLPI